MLHFLWTQQCLLSKLKLIDSIMHKKYHLEMTLGEPKEIHLYPHFLPAVLFLILV